MLMLITTVHWVYRPVRKGLSFQRRRSQRLTGRALKLHPDKRPDDPNAHEKFQSLKVSYNVLKDEKTRKLFDDHLRVKREHQRRRSEQEANHDSKRRRMVSDLEERERAAASAHPDPAGTVTRQEEERIVRKLGEEIARIREMLAKERTKSGGVAKEESAGGGSGLGLDKKKVLKVSWEKVGSYSAQRLKEIFSKFGKVEDVVINSSKKRGSALIVMESGDAIAAATRTVYGDPSNSLQVKPLVQPPVQATYSDFQQPVRRYKVDNNLVGAGYEEFEDSVLKKLQEAAQRQIL